MASAFTLACRVHSKREVHENGELDSTMYYINDGIYGDLNGVLCNENVHASTLKTLDEELYRSSIWGCTVDIYDLVISLDN